MNAFPSIGSWVWGASGNVCQVLKVQQHPQTKAVRLVVMGSQGQRIVPFESVKGVAQQKPIQIGDRVRLKNTAREYVVAEVYDHSMGLKDGEPSHEQWARLIDSGGKLAHWKVQQLETIS